MDGLRMKSTLVLGMLALGLASVAAQVPQNPQVQTPAKTEPVPAATGQAPAAAAPPLKLYSLNSETQSDPFPPVNPKYFTANSPSVATVEGYLKTMLGFDANRIWRVEGIQKTASPGVSKVTVLISERGSTAKPQGAIFFVLPDGKHLLTGETVTPFGADPFAPTRALLQAKADGPAHGSASKDLMLVEFSDLQCPHCKDAQATMAKLEQDFPKARIVYQAFPLVDIHPYAYQAAAYGVCVAQKSTDAYFTYAQAVYNTQGALLPDTAEQTLKDAVTKAGQDPAAIAACAASGAAKAQVDKSMALAGEVGVDQTPMLAVNGRLISFTSVPYETLKSLIVYQATLDGAAAAAISPAGSGVDLKAH
jgi:protein-disulfide isomerase